MLTLLPNVVAVSPRFRWRLVVADPDDDKFVDAYLAAGADVLVTNDAHFAVLSAIDFPHVEVVTPDAFRGALADGGSG